MREGVESLGSCFSLLAFAQGIPGVELVRMDVTDDASVNEAIHGIVRKAGPVEVLVNNAGYGPTGALEKTALQEACDQFETNFSGCCG